MLNSTRSRLRALLAILLLAVLFAPAAAAKRNEGVLNGRVLNDAGEALAGIRVTVTSPTAADFRLRETTDKQGQFTVKIRDAAGSYLVRLEGEGYYPYEAEIELAAGDRHQVEFRLMDEAAGRKQEAVVTFNDGAHAFQARDMATAEAKFRRAAELDPELASPHLGLADIYFSQQQYEAAAAEADRYLELEPGDPRGLGLAYEAHSRLGNEARVEELAEAMRGTELAPALATRLHNQGVVAAQQDDPVRAEERFRTAIELDPKLAAAHAALATVLYNQQSFDEALAVLERLQELEPESVQVFRLRFLIAEQRGDDDATAAALDAYLEAAPDEAVETLYQRADLDFRDGKVTAAEATLRRILEVRPDMAVAHYKLGLCYASSDAEKAKYHLQRFLELAPDDPEAADAREMLSYL